MCEVSDQDPLGAGAAIWDITGWTLEGTNCCLPQIEGEPICGDGNREENEECDGNDFGGLSCSDIIGYLSEGELACTEDCKIDTSDCYYDTGEQDFRLEVYALDAECPNDGGRVSIALTNNGDDVDNIYIYDTIYYDWDCNGRNGTLYLPDEYANMRFDCGDMSHEDVCIENYYVSYYYPGCYYHDVFVSSGTIGLLEGE